MTSLQQFLHAWFTCSNWPFAAGPWLPLLVMATSVNLMVFEKQKQFPIQQKAFTLAVPRPAPYEIFLLCLCLLVSFSALAQQHKLDSLLAVNDNYTKEDSLKVRHLTQVFRQYARMNDYGKMEEYAAKAITIAEKLPRSNSLTYVYERLGLCYHGASKFIQAINC
jgi:hypothetical protein